MISIRTFGRNCSSAPEELSLDVECGCVPSPQMESHGKDQTKVYTSGSVVNKRGVKARKPGFSFITFSFA